MTTELQPQLGPYAWSWMGLLSNASIRDFQQGTVGYVVNMVEQALVLPKDMADLRSMRQYDVFSD